MSLKNPCVLSSAGAVKLGDREIKKLKLQVPHWKIIKTGGVKKLRRVFLFKDFSRALAFTVKIGRLADAQDHHPAILTEWGQVTATLWTHKTNGLSRNDFILAAKIDAV